MFLINEDIEQAFLGVVQDIESSSNCPINGQYARFLSGADPWLIAVARSIGDCTVVSEETKSLSKYGLGEVCNELDVKHINVLDFFAENKIGWR